MKKLLLVILSSISLSAFSQTLDYTDLNKSNKPTGTFEKYISSTDDTYSVGDTLKIGAPSGVNGRFVYITRVDIVGTVSYPGTEAANTNAVIKKIRVGGNKRSGFKASFQTKGATSIDNYFFFLEDAIASGEIKSKGMTSDQALLELKKAKDKLELELITQEEYDKLKVEYAKYIK
jgi:hypothetical protein